MFIQIHIHIPSGRYKTWQNPLNRRRKAPKIARSQDLMWSCSPRTKSQIAGCWNSSMSRSVELAGRCRFPPMLFSPLFSGKKEPLKSNKICKQKRWGHFYPNTLTLMRYLEKTLVCSHLLLLTWRCSMMFGPLMTSGLLWLAVRKQCVASAPAKIKEAWSGKSSHANASVSSTTYSDTIMHSSNSNSNTLAVPVASGYIARVTSQFFFKS